jgi:hypothetical protein
MWEIQKLTPQDLEFKTCGLGYKVFKEGDHNSLYVYTKSMAEIVCEMLNDREFSLEK